MTCQALLASWKIKQIGLPYSGSVVLDKPYRDKSWHTPNKFLATFFVIIVQNMALEVESETLDSIDTSESKNTRGCSALSIQEHTRPPSNSEPVRNKKACLLF